MRFFYQARFPRLFLLFIVIGVIPCITVSCSNSGSSSTAGKLFDPGYGPFDKSGNYLEKEADTPAKQKRKPNLGSSSAIAASQPQQAKESYWDRRKREKEEAARAKEAEKLAKKQAEEAEKQAKENAKLAAQQAKEDAKKSKELATYQAKQEKEAAQQREEIARFEQKKAEEVSRNPPPSNTVAATKPAPKVASTPKPKPTPKVASAPKPKPKPAPKVASTPKPKPKPVVKVTPKTRYHLVKKGDTLYNISRRYSTSVSKIQSANGIKGTKILLGKTLKVPK